MGIMMSIPTIQLKASGCSRRFYVSLQAIIYTARNFSKEYWKSDGAGMRTHCAASSQCHHRTLKGNLLEKDN